MYIEGKVKFMDPNMMNQGYQMGGAEPQMMGYQEQTQAQVLNYNDVEMTAEKENKAKSTKKIALFCAIIGIILIGGGVFYKFNPTETTPTPAASETKNIEDQTVPEETTPVEDPNAQTAATNATCTLSDTTGTDGATRETVYTLVFDASSALMSYVKTYTVTAIDGVQKAAGSAKIKEENTAFTTILTSLNTTPVTGYTMGITPTQDGANMTALKVTINVDFSSLDVTKIPANVTANAITKVDLSKGQNQSEVQTTLGSFGYACQ
jgi:hypothetical protein